MNVTRLPTRTTSRPSIDLETIHDTLSYMHDDFARCPEFQKVAQAINRAMQEVGTAKQLSARTNGYSYCDSEQPTLAHPTTAQFVPFSRAF